MERFIYLFANQAEDKLQLTRPRKHFCTAPNSPTTKCYELHAGCNPWHIGYIIAYPLMRIATHSLSVYEGFPPQALVMEYCSRMQNYLIVR